jgi:SpoIID/LytB domain protein
MTMPFTRSLTALAIAASLLVAAAPPVVAADDSITFFGGGWGHGVGMSQYGAYGMAKNGSSADAIIKHYYTGVTAGALGVDVTGPNRLWVNILKGAAAATLVTKQISNPGVAITYSNGVEMLPVASGQSATVTIEGTTCTVTAPGVGVISSPTCTIDATWDGDAESPTSRFEVASVTPFGGSPTSCTNPDWNTGGSPVNCQYARGVMHIRPDDDTASFHLVMEMDVDDYILGIAEMPYSWGDTGGQEALRAQAIAARSYAVHNAEVRGDPAGRPFCWCHLYDTTADQNYVGWGHGLANWISATNDTAGVVYWHSYNDRAQGHIPIQAFYSSSTFGASEPNEIGFGGGPVPYLRSVPDPFSADPALNSRAVWSKEISLSSLAATLGMGSVVTAAVSAYSPSGAASKITFFGDGGPVTRDTRNLRTLLGTLSAQFTSLRVPTVSGPDNAGLHDPTTGLWHLRTSTGDTVSFYYGNPLDIPYAGDWDGNGTTTLGLYRQSTGFLFLRNSNTQGIADINIFYGNPGDLPIAGDWNGDGTDTVGIFRPSEAKVYLRNSNTQGIGDLSFPFGEAGDMPLAGDWNGDGRDTVALWRPSTRQVFFDYGLDGVTDFVYSYAGADPTDRVVAGDWNGDGIDTIGLFRPADAAFYLRDTFQQAAANLVIGMGESNMSPVAGAWGF